LTPVAPNWSRPLPRPLVIPKVMTLKTVGDVRTLIAKHLPAHFRDKQTWQHVAAELDKAAAGGDTADLSIALRMALTLEGVECRPK
jgi:hypothetical protein